MNINFHSSKTQVKKRWEIKGKEREGIYTQQTLNFDLKSGKKTR